MKYYVMIIVVFVVVLVGVIIFEKSKASRFEEFVLDIQSGTKAVELFKNKDGFSVSFQNSLSSVGDRSTQGISGECSIEYNGLIVHRKSTFPVDSNGAITKNASLINEEDSDF